MIEQKMKREEKTDVTQTLQEKIDLYSGMLYKIAFLQLQNYQDAEDVVQDTFYRYIKASPVFESGEHERAWFIKVTLNGCRKVFRCAWYRHRDALPVPELAEESSMEQDLVKREQRRELLAAVFELPGKYREVLHLFYFEELPIKRIAEVTGRKESTVTSQLTRGRELLRKKIREEYQYEF